MTNTAADDVANLEHLGVYACRIRIPSMSNIYPIDDLEWAVMVPPFTPPSST